MSYTLIMYELRYVYSPVVLGLTRPSLPQEGWGFGAEAARVGQAVSSLSAHFRWASPRWATSCSWRVRACTTYHI
jgi:hypothetical protein